MNLINMMSYLTAIYVPLKHYLTRLLALFNMRRRHLTTNQRELIVCLVCLLVCAGCAYIFVEGVPGMTEHTQ
jgi:hypothetical protein